MSGSPGGLEETGSRGSEGSRGPARSGGHGADGQRDALLGRAPREVRRQMQHDPPHRALDPDRELEQLLAERADLRSGAPRALGVKLQAQKSWRASRSWER